jgi:hypothetical protein
MENIEIIILNIVVLCCFLAFFISTFRAFEKVESKGVDFKEKKGIISRLFSYFESLF